MKMKHFLWLPYKDRIQSAVQLRKGTAMALNFIRCWEFETANHILFKFPIAVGLLLCGAFAEML